MKGNRKNKTTFSVHFYILRSKGEKVLYLNIKIYKATGLLMVRLTLE